MSEQNSSKLPPPSLLKRRNPCSIIIDGEEDDGLTRSGGYFLPSGLKAQNSILKLKPPSTLPETPVKVTEPPSKPYSWGSQIKNDVPELPLMWSLERTAVFVPNVSLVDQVVDRIDTILRLHSIEAHFDHNTATCTTLEGVEFEVHLFRARGSRFGHGLIVEVQRLFGTSQCFHQDTRAILLAAVNKKPQNEPRMERLPPLFNSEDNGDTDASTEKSCAFDVVSKMFQHPRTRCLALEALVTFTNPDRMNSKTAKEVSLQLVEPDNCIGDAVISLILEDTTDNELRIMAMEALGNALPYAKRCALPINELRLVLKQDLCLYDTNPRASYMAARCLQHIMDHTDKELSDALRASFIFGQSRYLALARQSRRCLESRKSINSPGLEKRSIQS